MINRRALMVGAVGVAWSTAAKADDRLTAAVNRFSSGAPLYIARAAGFFAEQNLDVDLLHATSAQTLGLAVTAGDAPVGLTALTAGIFTLADRGGLKLIAGGWEERPGFKGNAVVVGNAAYARGVRRLTDLVGLRIGATQTGSPQENQWARVAGKSGFEYSDLKMIPLQTLPNVLSALRGAQVEAAALPATLSLQLERSGAGKIIAWMGDVTPGLFGGITANTGTISQDPDLVTRFLRAYLKAIAYYDAAVQQRDAQGRPVNGEHHQMVVKIIADYLQEPPDQVASGLPYFNPRAPLMMTEIDQQIDVWKSLGLVGPSMSALTVTEDRFLKAMTASDAR